MQEHKRAQHEAADPEQSRPQPAGTPAPGTPDRDKDKTGRPPGNPAGKTPPPDAPQHPAISVYTREHNRTQHKTTAAARAHPADPAQAPRREHGRGRATPENPC